MRQPMFDIAASQHNLNQKQMEGHVISDTAVA